MNYTDFCKTDDHSLNIARAIDHCKKNGINTLVFDKSTYVLKPQRASERELSISNHNVHGFTTIGMLIEDMDGFTIDGGGSTFICDGVMVSSAILRSSNITIKNMTLEATEHLRMEATVTEHGEDSFTVKVTNDTDYVVTDKKLYFKNSHGHLDPFHYYLVVRRENDDGGYIPETAETYKKSIRFEDLGDGYIRVGHPTFVPDIGMRLIIAPDVRRGATFFADSSKNIRLENVNIQTSYGMGVIGQFCENVSIDRMTIKQKDGALHSTNNDGTHFVFCSGEIRITNSHFEGMLDDALNVHGFYTPIERIDEKGVLISFRQPGSTCPFPYRKGSRVFVLSENKLVRERELTVSDVTVINEHCAYLEFNEGNDGLSPELLLEDAQLAPDIIFDGNTVQNNRGRGVLPQTTGKVRIRNNYFHTTGASVLFIGGIGLWYESGGTNDVLIESNVFDECGYCTKVWGKAVIETRPRDEFDGKLYFHESIVVKNNEFKNNVRPLLYAYNTARVEFTGNKISNTVSPNVYKDCGEIVE